MSTVVTEESWFGRIGNALKGIVFGLILSVISVPLLFWNEGRAVKTAKGLKEGAGAVVQLDSDSVSPDNDGKFVHVSGTVNTNDTLRDEPFGIELSGIRLNRSVEMYQWVEDVTTESKKKLGGGKRTETTYSYDKEWANRHVDSSAFENPAGHENPAMPFQGNTSEASDVTLGDFRLPGSLVGQISAPEPVPVDAEKISDDIAANITVRDEAGVAVAYWRDGGQYDGQPSIGDTRISFSATPISEVSVMSKQVGNSFEPYVTQQETRLNMLSMGKVSPDVMIKQAEAANTRMTWILRGIGAGMMFFGFVLFLKPLSVFADVIPMFGTVVGAGTGVVAFLLAAAGSLITIAVAWIFYRPLLGIGLLAVAAIALFMLFSRARNARLAAQQNEANPNALAN